MASVVSILLWMCHEESITSVVDVSPGIRMIRGHLSVIKWLPFCPFFLWGIRLESNYIALYWTMILAFVYIRIFAHDVNVALSSGYHTCYIESMTERLLISLLLETNYGNSNLSNNNNPSKLSEAFMFLIHSFDLKLRSIWRVYSNPKPIWRSLKEGSNAT